MYDPKVPTELKNTQEWFAGIITQPVDKDSQIPALSPHGVPIIEEAALYISKSPTLLPHQRIQLYCQQYWWRLLSTLQDSFPLVVRLFGYYDFNFLIAVPFLIKYPPIHWSLSLLGDKLPEWVTNNYTDKDKQLVYHAVLLDLIFQKSFVVKSTPPLQNQIETIDDSLLEKSLTLQSHLFLISLPYDLLTARKTFLSESPEYWIDNDFPVLTRDQTYHFAIYRSAKGVSWQNLSDAEKAVLSCFKQGSTIEEICNWLEDQPEMIQKEAEENLQSWFQRWVLNDWLTIYDSETTREYTLA